MRIRLAVILAFVGLTAWYSLGDTSSGPFWIGAPNAAPTMVQLDGRVDEDWGSFGLAITSAAPGTLRDRTVGVGTALDCGPRLTVRKECGPLTLATSVYRAPVWPSGADVLQATVRNASSQPQQARLIPQVTGNVQLGDLVASAGGRLVLTLPTIPQPERKERDWGCTGGVVPMPGWARPNRECDPAFRNISAGMGGVPITYRFAVPPASGWIVVLGFCESHWGMAGQRSIIADVEGAERRELDPIALWGQHGPGVLRFDARDADGDGKLRITVDPHPDAPDKNTILNTIWIFPPGPPLNLDEVLRGKLSAGAKYYVDVGGEKDQLLYEPGSLYYPLTLAPGAEQTLTFLLAAPGSSVPNPAASSWTPETLRHAAERVWSGWFAGGHPFLGAPASSRHPGEGATDYRYALAQIAMSTAQADDFYLALPQPGGVDQFSWGASFEIIRALDAAGFYREAERLLRLYWDKPVPQPFAALAQANDGKWPDQGDPCAQGLALCALGQHAVATGGKEWAARVYPAVAKGVDWLLKEKATGRASSGEAASWAAAGLTAAAGLAALVKEEGEPRWREAAGAFGQPADAAKAQTTATGPCVEAARQVPRAGAE